MDEKTIYNVHLDGHSSLRPAINMWGIYLKEKGRSHFTIRSFLGDINLLASFIPTDRMINEICTRDLNHFLEWIHNGRGQGIPCSPKSFSRRITSLKSFFRWLHDHAIISIDPAEVILQHSVLSPLPEILNPIEEQVVSRVVKEISQSGQCDTRPFVLLILLLETGIKKTECINIHRNHLEISSSNPYLFVRYLDARDRKKERKISISLEWVNKLSLYYEQYKIENVLFPWSPRRLEYLLEDIGKSANLSKHLSFSMCRWTFAVNEIRNNKEPDLVRQELGVSKIQWRELKMKLNQLVKLTS